MVFRWNFKVDFSLKCFPQRWHSNCSNFSCTEIMCFFTTSFLEKNLLQKKTLEVWTSVVDIGHCGLSSPAFAAKCFAQTEHLKVTCTFSFFGLNWKINKKLFYQNLIFVKLDNSSLFCSVVLLDFTLIFQDFINKN